MVAKFEFVLVRQDGRRGFDWAGGTVLQGGQAVSGSGPPAPARKMTWWAKEGAGPRHPL